MNKVSVAMRLTLGFFAGCILVLVLLAAPSARAANYNPLPDTGQNLCYDEAGAVITCPAPGQPYHGQDAQYQGPQPSYTDNGNGTVTDNNTGLIWQQNTADVNGDGGITSSDYPAGDQIAWQGALDYCAGLTFAGTADWRLPSRFELLTLVDRGRYDQAINPLFGSVSSYYWTATTNAVNTANAWVVDFAYGYIDNYNKTTRDYVRCVRGGL